ncbi:transient receptor potential cation channel protein painless-like [Zootermopsis nevadensis]|uniref:Transient receptor potential cation channel protein painless n=1 Tax=Zootermopsis nevadensis TaxID=136037 RepID=A0A067R6H8_ZOONE|nr:transient receptor potential cation channel protein painless-like [Zootermopsis nevadensis]KDR14973.1 Transient receptor potential cation channel protein painless [Zootermopsis nevadensis]
MSKFKVTGKQNQQHLLKYLEDGDFGAFINLLKGKDKNDINLNHEYSDPYYKTCLAIACQKGMVEFVEVLLANNADSNLICKSYDGNAPIHFAAENGQIHVIKRLVQHPDTNISAINRKGETALHLSARSLGKNDKAEECFSYLASIPGMSASHRSANDRSAISDAVGKCSGGTLQKVLQRRDLRPEDRNLILHNHPELKDEVPESAEHTYAHDDAYMDLRNGNVDTFRHNFKEEFVNRTDLIQMTFLQLACKQGLLDIVELLLNSGADVNKTGTHESKPPVYIACYYGHYDILRCLYNTRDVKTELIEGKTLLHEVLRGFSAKREARDSYRDCFNFLLQEQETFNIPINHGDSFGHTALHYAVQEDNDQFAKALLAHGAYIGSLNDFDVCPLDDIDPETLEKALDDCVECTKEENDNEYTLRFNFRILNPALGRDSERPKDEESGEWRKEMLPEMFPLYFISQSNKFRHLLKHPVLLMFLHMKWSRISIIFYLNMIYYIIFVVFLTSEILSDSNMCGKCGQNFECDESGVRVIRALLFFLYVVLVFRELMQFCMSPEKSSYFYNLENWLEIGIITTTLLILIGSCSKILTAVALLLAWTEVILQFGCIYTLAIYNEMLKRVTVNYMKFLLWYSPLIIAFTFSFYKVYHNEASSEDKGANYSARNLSASVQDNGVDFYSNLPMSLLKTVVMMTGEFDASGMTFDHGGYFVFLFFVFMMTIVLINLLNGLAVSDTQAIKNDAELVAYKSRAKLVHQFEIVAFGGPIHNRYDYELIGQSRSLCCAWQHKLLRTISLFPNVLAGGSLDITVNRGTRYTNRNLKRKDVEFRPDTCFTIGKCRIGFNLDRKVIEAAKDIVDRRTKESKHVMKRIAKIEDDVQGCKRQLETLEKLLRQLINISREK